MSVFYLLEEKRKCREFSCFSQQIMLDPPHPFHRHVLTDIYLKPSGELYPSGTYIGRGSTREILFLWLGIQVTYFSSRVLRHFVGPWAKEILVHYWILKLDIQNLRCVFSDKMGH